MKIRRVVTGHTAAGQAVVASDTAVDGITLGLLPGMEFHRLWGGDDHPVFPDNGAPPSAPAYFPPLHGFRFGMFTVAPYTTTLQQDLDVPAALVELETKLPGLAAYMEPDNPGMHTTDTVDFEYVISGEVWLELDNGKQVHLKAGDTVVQNGTRHAWRNRTAEPCRMVVCLIGARRR